MKLRSSSRRNKQRNSPYHLSTYREGEDGRSDSSTLGVKLPSLPSYVLQGPRRFGSVQELVTEANRISVLYEEFAVCRRAAADHVDDVICRRMHAHNTLLAEHRLDLRHYILSCTVRMVQVDIERVRLKSLVLLCRRLRFLSATSMSDSKFSIHELPPDIFKYIINLAAELMKIVPLPFALAPALRTPNELLFAGF